MIIRGNGTIDKIPKLKFIRYIFIILSIFYTSTGEDTKYFEQFKTGNRTVVFVNNGSTQGKKLMDGEIKLQDSTKGLISLKAYKKHLADEASGEIVKQLQAQLKQNIS